MMLVHVPVEKSTKSVVEFKMITKLIKVNSLNPEDQVDVIRECASIIKLDGLVAFPTETVYGLGANAFSSIAVKKIYTAKGRPSDNPLIVHISKKDDIHLVAKNISKKAELLINAFWPGPLTLVVEKSERIPLETSGGLNTIGIRLPLNKIARLLIEKSGPLAAPSANLSGMPSPTKVQHVIDDLDTKINAVIDGGCCKYGLESTIVDVTTNTPCLLRPGSITLNMLEQVIGKVDIDKTVKKNSFTDEKPKAPGMKYKHYSPIADITVIIGKQDNIIKNIIKLAKENNNKVGIMATDKTIGIYQGHGLVISVGDRDRPETIAANLFRTFREFDNNKVNHILAEGFLGEGIEFAIMNRLIKAAAYNIINV